MKMVKGGEDGDKKVEIEELMIMGVGGGKFGEAVGMGGFGFVWRGGLGR
ncbi:hypothetical protein [Bacillus altitudinis]